MNEISRSIANYAQAGIAIEILEKDADCWTIKIAQQRLMNGLILNQKELVDRVKAIFDPADIKTKVIPVTYTLQISDVTVGWVEEQMAVYKINRKDLTRQLALDQDELDAFFNGSRVNRHIRVSLFYYFLNHGSSRSDAADL